MENRTLTKKTAAIYFAVIFLLNKILSAISNVIVMSRYDGIFEDMADSAIASYYSSALMSVANLLINIVTIAAIIIAGKKLTGNKIGTIRFLGCYYFGAAVGTLFSSLISNVFQYLMRFVISPTTGSTIITVSSILCLVPAILAAYMAFTAFEGLNDKITAHPLNVSLSKARIIFIVTFILTLVVSSAVGTLPNYLMALIMPESGSFASNALIFSGYLAKWLTNVIAFAIVYIAGYITTKSHYGAINFYLPANAFSVPVTAVIGNISSVIVTALKYSDMLKVVENGGADYLSSTMYSGYIGYISMASTVLTLVVSFAICFKAFSMFYKKKTEVAPVEAG